MTLVMLGITLGLGTWQLQRLAWKEGLLAEIEQGEATAPVPLAAAAQPFRRVVATGQFLPVVARYGTEVRQESNGAVIGSYVLGLLQRPGALTLVVNRGWAPPDAAVPVPPGKVEVVGYVRPPDHASWFSIGDDTLTRTFYTLDPAVIGPALGVADVAPFALVALGPASGPASGPALPLGTYPEPATALPRPPNDHLSYAITWFGLSAALAVVFAVYAGQVLARRQMLQ